jgi:hypothetical protein
MANITIPLSAKCPCGEPVSWDDSATGSSSRSVSRIMFPNASLRRFRKCAREPSLGSPCIDHSQQLASKAALCWAIFPPGSIACSIGNVRFEARHG